MIRPAVLTDFPGLAWSGVIPAASVTPLLIALAWSAS